MDNDTLIPALRKKSSRKVIAVALLAIHGIFLIIIGLMAFLGGFIGIYAFSHGRITSGVIAAVLGAFLAWLLLLEGILSLLCAQGLWKRRRWAFWLTIGLEVTTLLLAACTIWLRFFTAWPFALSMGFAAVILLYTLMVIEPRTLSSK